MCRLPTSPAVSPAVPSWNAAITPVATVVTAPVAALPATLPSTAITYDSSTTQVMPPNTADLVMTKTRN
jgi:hypothetical protein